MALALPVGISAAVLIAAILLAATGRARRLDQYVVENHAYWARVLRDIYGRNSRRPGRLSPTPKGLVNGVMRMAESARPSSQDGPASDHE